MNLISPRVAKLCHHFVSVRAGTRHTTVAPSREAVKAFAIQRPMSLPYGGFIQQTPRHSCFSPSISGVKKTLHLVLCTVAQTSTSKWNSASSALNVCSGVSQLSLVEVKSAALSTVDGVLIALKVILAFGAGAADMFDNVSVIST